MNVILFSSLVCLSLSRLLMGGTSSKFTMYSQPIELRYGEVYNKMQSDGNLSDHKLPQDVIARYESGEKVMAIKGFTLDIVRKAADGSETQVKLNDHYLHHYVLYFGGLQEMQKLADSAKKHKHVNHMLTSCHAMNGMGLRMVKNYLAAVGGDNFNGVSFGSAAGAEYRHNPQEFQSPYRLLLHKPEVWLPTFHVINTRGDNHTVSPLLECPCTPQRRIDPEAGTIDGRKPDPPFGCSAGFAKTGNPSCSLKTYRGGWRCCEHQMFLIDTDKECRLPGCADKPADKVFMKFTFEYEDAAQETRDVENSPCCDTTGDQYDFGNLEHDVPACPAGTPVDQCIFVSESVQTIGIYRSSLFPSDVHSASDLVDIVQAEPHLHVAGISLALIDHETNETVCEVHRTDDWKGGIMYGRGDEPGNEKGYLVGLTPCTWGGQSPRRFRRGHLFRSRSVYNATYRHTGVMSLWINTVSAVPNEIKNQVLV